jgi:hypothetical protein
LLKLESVDGSDDFALRYGKLEVLRFVLLPSEHFFAVTKHLDRGWLIIDSVNRRSMKLTKEDLQSLCTVGKGVLLPEITVDELAAAAAALGSKDCMLFFQ